MVVRMEFRLTVLILCALALSFALSGIAEGSEPWTTLDALESFRPHQTDADEPEDDRRARLQRTADAIDSAAQTRQERALLLAVGRHESHFARGVCEGGRTGDKGRAWGCWQSWERERGPVELQARKAAEHLRRAGNYCAARGFPRVRGAISLYATGRGCNWVGASERVETYRRIVWRLAP